MNIKRMGILLGVLFLLSCEIPELNNNSGVNPDASSNILIRLTSKIQAYSSKDVLQYSCSYTYDELNRHKAYSYENSVTPESNSYMKYSYPSDQQQIAKSYNDEMKLQYYSITDYRTKDLKQFVKMESFQTDDTCVSRFNYEYDDQGRISKSRSYYAEGLTLQSYSIYSYPALHQQRVDNYSATDEFTGHYLWEGKLESKKVFPASKINYYSAEGIITLQCSYSYNTENRPIGYTCNYPKLKTSNSSGNYEYLNNGQVKCSNYDWQGNITGYTLTTYKEK